MQRRFLFAVQFLPFLVLPFLGGCLSAPASLREGEPGLRPDADDWRRRSPEFGEPKLSMNIALRDALRPIAERHATTVSVVAVAWTLSTPGVTAAIVGARSAQQVDGWIDAGRITLTTEDLAEIAAAVERTQQG